MAFMALVFAFQGRGEDGHSNLRGGDDSRSAPTVPRDGASLRVVEMPEGDIDFASQGSHGGALGMATEAEPAYRRYPGEWPPGTSWSGALLPVLWAVDACESSHGLDPRTYDLSRDSGGRLQIHRPSWAAFFLERYGWSWQSIVLDDSRNFEAGWVIYHERAGDTFEPWIASVACWGEGLRHDSGPLKGEAPVLAEGLPPYLTRRARISV